MAQKVRIILEDDLDGGPADETIRFGLDGAHYEIDLSSANAARLRDAIRPFVAKSRRVHLNGARQEISRNNLADNPSSRAERQNDLNGIFHTRTPLFIANP